MEHVARGAMHPLNLSVNRVREGGVRGVRGGRVGGAPRAKENRVRLTLEEKKQVVTRRAEGESAFSIAADFGIHPDSVNRIVRQSPKLHEFQAQCQDKSRKNAKNPFYNEIDKQLIQWFYQRRAQCEPISGPILKAKAVEINDLIEEQSGISSGFKASEGWLTRFKNRHGIRELTCQGERHSADDIGATVYVGELEEELREADYDLRDVYNMDETGLYWKCLPRRTLAHAGEKRADGGKVLKDRITVAVCANATGSHRLPLLVVGKYAKPRCFKHCTSLPVIYRNQGSAWITSELFEKWVREDFKPAVELRQSEEGRSDKVLLLVDNCAAHKLGTDHAGATMAVNDKITIKFLPPNTTSLIQPMDQGCIMKMKRVFQKKLLMAALRCDGGLREFFADYDLKDAIDFVAAAWKELTPDNLRRAWRKLLPTMQSDGEPLDAADTAVEVEIRRDTDEVAELLNQAGGNIPREEVDEWLTELATAEAQVEPPVSDQATPLDDGHDSDTDDEDLDCAFRVVAKWAEKQPDFIKNPFSCIFDYYSNK